jgi:hypothetical protein
VSKRPHTAPIERQFEANRRATHPAVPAMKPAAYLAQHPVARRLKALGVTAAQLKSAQFLSYDGDEFRDWRAVSAKPWPPGSLSDMRVWCALRWLILDDPPPSRDRRDAWELVADYMGRPTYEAVRRQQRNLAFGRQTANALREDEADKKALDAFCSWQKAARGALTLSGRELPAVERVERYFTSRPPSRRHRERIQKLLGHGKIS